MSRSLAELINKQKEKYQTLNQTAKDFKTGDRVKVIVACQDFHFFDDETGVVCEVNENDPYGITIKLDEVRHYPNWTMEYFPLDLRI